MSLLPRSACAVAAGLAVLTGVPAAPQAAQAQSTLYAFCYLGYRAPKKVYYTGIFEAPASARASPYGLHNIEREFEEYVEDRYNEESIRNEKKCETASDPGVLERSMRQAQSGRWSTALYENHISTRWTP